MSYESDCADFNDPALEALVDEQNADCADNGAFDGLDDQHEIACDDFCPDCGEHGDNCDCWARLDCDDDTVFDAIDDYDVPF
jgi:hypothetical protein